MWKYFIYLINRYIFVRKIHEFLKLFNLLQHQKFWIYVRTQGDMNFLSSFVLYIHDKEKILQLKKNLDNKTISRINKILKKITLLTQNNILSFSQIFQTEDIQNAKSFAHFLKQNKNHPFPINAYYLTRTQEIYNFDLQGKDIIDLWACEGDSAITFAMIYGNSTVYWFEPELKNFKRFEDNITKYAKNLSVIPVQYGVSNFEWVAKFQGTWAGATIGWTIWEEVKITTIDKYVFDNGLQPGMMKWDIEWLEYNSILWAEKTIKTFKPILFISIYHTGKDFFEIKPLIESWDLWYKFWIEKWHNGHPFADTVLVCY